MDRVIKGTYSDFKIIKSRKIAQMIIEVPLEAANNLIDMFGLPRPDQEQWVAVAALDLVSSHRNDDATKAIQLAGMICRDIEFGKWLKSSKNMKEVDPDSHESIANALRALLGIKSRTDMNNSPDTVTAFNRLIGEYNSWKMN